METLKKNAMMFRTVNAECTVNFNNGFFMQTWTAVNTLADYAELFHIKGYNGASPARVLYNRLKKFYDTNVRDM